MNEGVRVTEELDTRFNVLNHELVPLHELVPEEEAVKVLQSLRVRADQLPKILTTDPACKVVSAAPGDLIRITRKSKTAGHHVVYRVVVLA